LYVPDWYPEERVLWLQGSNIVGSNSICKATLADYADIEAAVAESNAVNGTPDVDPIAALTARVEQLEAHLESQRRYAAACKDVASSWLEKPPVALHDQIVMLGLKIDRLHEDLSKAQHKIEPTQISENDPSQDDAGCGEPTGIVTGKYCSVCKGSGQGDPVAYTGTCGNCEGTGVVSCYDAPVPIEASLQYVNAENDRLEFENADLRQQLDAMHSERDGNYWAWSDVDDNHLESMCNDLIVIIRARQLRELLEDAADDPVQDDAGCGFAYTESDKSCIHVPPMEADPAAPEKPKRRRVWCNEYPFGRPFGIPHLSSAEAIEQKSSDCIGQVEFVEVLPGDGDVFEDVLFTDADRDVLQAAARSTQAELGKRGWWEPKADASYQCAAEWRDKFRVAEAEIERLQSAICDGCRDGLPCDSGGDHMLPNGDTVPCEVWRLVRTQEVGDE
jgi:hypothetical protein